MAKTKGTHPYSGLPHCSGRNQKPAPPDEIGGACKSRKKGVPKGQRKDPPELHACLNAQAEVAPKDQESLGRDSAAALEHHQPTVSDNPTHPNAQAQLQRKDQESLCESPPPAGMPTLIRVTSRAICALLCVRWVMFASHIFKGVIPSLIETLFFFMLPKRLIFVASATLWRRATIPSYIALVQGSKFLHCIL